jgi:hypothetical protein
MSPGIRHFSPFLVHPFFTKIVQYENVTMVLPKPLKEKCQDWQSALVSALYKTIRNLKTPLITQNYRRRNVETERQAIRVCDSKHKANKLIKAVQRAFDRFLF